MASPQIGGLSTAEYKEQEIDWTRKPNAAAAYEFRRQQCPSFVYAQHLSDSTLLDYIQEAKADLNRQIDQLQAELEQVLHRSCSQTRAMHPVNGILDATETISDAAFEIRQRHEESIDDGDTDQSGATLKKKIPYDPKSHRKLGQRYPLCSTTDVELGSLGVGLRLYFFVLKFLAALFFVLGFITLPAITSFAAEHLYEHSSAVRFRSPMADLTLGNVYANYSRIEQAKSSTLFVAAETDALATLVSVIAILWLGSGIKAIALRTDQENATMQDYTIQLSPVRRIPTRAGGGTKPSPESPRAKAAKLRRLHASCRQRTKLCIGGDTIGWDDFSETKATTRGVACDTQVPTAHEWGGSSREEFHKVVQDTLDRALWDRLRSNEGESRAEELKDAGSYVARKPYRREQRTIWSAWDEEDNIELWERKLELLHGLEDALAQAHLVRARGGVKENKGSSDEQRVRAAQWKLVEPALRKLQTVNRKLACQNPTDRLYKPVAAFVTFEHAQVQLEALRLSWNEEEIGTICIGEWVCAIQPAPEPDTVEWGHLAYSRRNQSLRR